MEDRVFSRLLGYLYRDDHYADLGNPAYMHKLAPKCRQIRDVVPSCFLALIEIEEKYPVLRPGYYITQLADFVHDATDKEKLNTVVTPLYIGRGNCVLLVNLPYYKSCERPLERDMMKAWDKSMNETLTDGYYVDHAPKIYFAGLSDDGLEMLSNILACMQGDDLSAMLHTSIVTIKTPLPRSFDTFQLRGTRKGPHEGQHFCDTSRLSECMLAFKEDS